MTEIRRGATETLTIELPDGIDPVHYPEIYIDIVQDDLVITRDISGITIQDQILETTLTTAETLEFQSGYHGWIQLTMTDESGETLVSNKEDFQVLPILIERGGN